MRPTSPVCTPPGATRSVVDHRVALRQPRGRRAAGQLQGRAGGHPAMPAIPSVTAMSSSRPPGTSMTSDGSISVRWAIDPYGATAPAKVHAAPVEPCHALAAGHRRGGHGAHPRAGLDEVDRIHPGQDDRDDRLAVLGDRVVEVAGRRRGVGRGQDGCAHGHRRRPPGDGSAERRGWRPPQAATIPESASSAATFSALPLPPAAVRRSGPCGSTPAPPVRRRAGGRTLRPVRAPQPCARPAPRGPAPRARARRCPRRAPPRRGRRASPPTARGTRRDAAR